MITTQHQLRKGIMLNMIYGAALALACVKFSRHMNKPLKSDVQESWDSVQRMMEDF